MKELFFYVNLYIFILNKLNKYREKANRDRFILPLEKDITLFTDIIDESINFLN